MVEFGSEFLRQLHESLAELRTTDTVELRGQWHRRSRRTYRDSSQLGSGAGPFVTVDDYCWEGSMSASTGIVAIAFLVSGTELYWVKSRPPRPTLELTINASAFTDYQPDRATVSFGLGGTWLPGVPVAVGHDISVSLPVITGPQPLCALLSVVRAAPVEFFALVLPGHMVGVGRNRLWHLREGHAAALPGPARTLLARRRTGHISG
jgi:hypothetical protein